MSVQRSHPWVAKPPERWEAMIESMSSTRLFLLQKTGPTRFVIKGENSDVKHVVCVGQDQKCSCSLPHAGHHHYCIHLLFVMAKVLRVSPSSLLFWQKSLVDSEVDKILQESGRAGGANASASLSGSTEISNDSLMGTTTTTTHTFLRRGSGRTSSVRSTGRGSGGAADGGGGDMNGDEEVRTTGGGGGGSDGLGAQSHACKGKHDVGAAAGSKRKGVTEDEVCPICLEQMTSPMAEEGTEVEVEVEVRGGGGHSPSHLAIPLTWCRNGCGNNMHIKCMTEFATHQAAHGKKKVTCPNCRADWGPRVLESLKEQEKEWKAQRRKALTRKFGVPLPVRCRGCQIVVKGKEPFYRCLACYSTTTSTPSTSTTTADAIAGSTTWCRSALSMTVDLCQKCYFSTGPQGLCRAKGHPFVQSSAAQYSSQCTPCSSFFLFPIPRWQPAPAPVLMAPAFESQNPLSLLLGSGAPPPSFISGLTGTHKKGPRGLTSSATATAPALLPSYLLTALHPNVDRSGQCCVYCTEEPFPVWSARRALPCGHIAHDECLLTRIGQCIRRRSEKGGPVVVVTSPACPGCNSPVFCALMRQYNKSTAESSSSPSSSPSKVLKAEHNHPLHGQPGSCGLGSKDGCVSGLIVAGSSSAIGGAAGRSAGGGRSGDDDDGGGGRRRDRAIIGVGGVLKGVSSGSVKSSLSFSSSSSSSVCGSSDDPQLQLQLQHQLQQISLTGLAVHHYTDTVNSRCLSSCPLDPSSAPTGEGGSARLRQLCHGRHHHAPGLPNSRLSVVGGGSSSSRSSNDITNGSICTDDRSHYHHHRRPPPHRCRHHSSPSAASLLCNPLADQHHDVVVVDGRAPSLSAYFDTDHFSGDAVLLRGGGVRGGGSLGACSPLPVQSQRRGMRSMAQEKDSVSLALSTTDDGQGRNGGSGVDSGNGGGLPAPFQPRDGQALEVPPTTLEVVSKGTRVNKIQSSGRGKIRKGGAFGVAGNVTRADRLALIGNAHN